jgi:hypothetical protein
MSNKQVARRAAGEAESRASGGSVVRQAAASRPCPWRQARRRQSGSAGWVKKLMSSVLFPRRASAARTSISVGAMDASPKFDTA